MSQKNVEIVRRAYEAWNRDDFDATLLLIHSGVEWRGPGDLFLGVEEVYRGHAGVREWWDAVKEPWKYFESHIERNAGSRRQGSDSRPVRRRRPREWRQGRVALVRKRWELNCGLVIRFIAYYLEEALEAVGLSE